MFATGIENSIPTIDGGRVRVDQMEACGHYRHWRTDFDLVGELGIGFLRYGPPLHLSFPAAGRYDWSFADETFAELKRRGIVPDRGPLPLRRAGLDRRLPEPDFPRCSGLRARIRRALPVVQLYTRSTRCHLRRFSARYGWWNEQLKTDQAFVTPLKIIVKANVLAMQASRGPAGRDLHPERDLGVFPRRQPGGDPAGETKTRALPHADLNYGRRSIRDVRVPARQRHDAGGVPLLL
jgi:hypothetical protein